MYHTRYQRYAGVFAALTHVGAACKNATDPLVVCAGLRAYVACTERAIARYQDNVAGFIPDMVMSQQRALAIGQLVP